MQVLLDKTKHDQDWNNKIESYDTITQLNSIEKTLLDQIKYQYFYAKVYDQECALYQFQHHNLTNR